MKDLPGGSIVPVAQGVDTFIRPSAFQQAPGLPQLRVFSSGPAQIARIGQESGGSVRGFNQWAQLAEALAPFNDALTKTAIAGGEMYASAEYEKGRNDAIKAQILSNQQRLQGGAAWNAEVRRVEGLDPEAARMMDRVNPFRQAGRDNQRARMAAEETKTYILQAYRSTPGAETWKAGDPRLAEIKVRATQEILDRFGLDQGSAGFQDYVNPQIAQAWDRVTEEQDAAHQKWTESTIPRLTAVEMLQQFSGVRANKLVEWMELDPATQQPVRRQARLGDRDFNYGVGQMLGQTLGRMQGELGPRGKFTDAAKQAYLQLAEMVGIASMSPTTAPEEAQALGDLLKIAGGLEFGPPMRDGRRATLAELFAPEAYSLAKELAKDSFERQARTEAVTFQQWANEATKLLLANPAGSPGYEGARQQLQQAAIEMGLPLDKAMSVLDSVGGNIESIALRGVDSVPVEDFLAQQRLKDPSDFNLREAQESLAPLLRGMPRSEQAKRWAELGRIGESKDKEAQNGRGAVLNPILTQGIKAALRQQYPGSTTEAALRGVKDIAGFMAMGDVNMETAASRLKQGATLHMQRRLDEEARKKGERLSNTEQTAVATNAFNEFMTTVGKDERLRKQLFPGGLTGGDSLPGAQPANPQQNTRGEAMSPPAPPPGRQWSRGPVVSSSNLDNVDPERLKRGDVVLQKPSVMNEVFRVLEGRPPSAAVQRAARAAGMPVAQWLLKQADAYPGSLQPEARRELLKKVNQGQAAGQKISSSARPSPYQQASSWLIDMMMGTRPAMASQGGGGSPFPFSQGRFQETGSGSGYTPIRNVIITSAVDPESPGFDMAIEGGRRGAPFRWPMPFRVVAVERNQRENNMERTGNRSDRFYGNNVTLRFRSPVDGREYDVISSHHDKLNPALRPGGRFPAGTFIGTQGRTGSTTGTHTSLDVYVAGTRRPAPMAVRSHLRDGFARGSTFGNGGGRPMPAQGTMTGKATYYTGSGGSDGVLGGKTANGEVFTGKQMTAAVQWSLKPKLMNKWLIVEDVGTGRRIRVWANDTGQMGGTKSRPADRLIDLSPVAFTKLFGSTSRGVGNIRVMVDPNQRGRP